MKTQKTKILLVDDEADVIEFLSYNFRKKNYEVASALNGIEGIEQVRSFVPDIIIADIMMPGMDGITMCKMLKLDRRYRDIPVIFLSAVQDDYRAMSAGMAGDDYVSKPVTFPVLLSMAEKFLSVNG
jgi:two-component system, OmpR family, alkaline phosphatase synthesis response regulator PhoP